MKNERIHSEISDCCSLNKFEKAIKMLVSYVNDIDLTYKDGTYFRQAIKYNNVKMLNTLLEYYEKKQLKADPENQYAIPLAKQKLQIILQDAVKSFDVSSEMQEVLNQYLPTEEDSDSEQELDDIVMPFFNKSIELTEDNLKKLASVENNQIKNFEDLMGFYSSKMETDLGNDHHENNEHNLDLVGKNNYFIDTH